MTEAIYKNRPKYEATEKIESYIRAHNFQPHTKLPSERDMCEMWELSRTSVRRAINRLVNAGAIYSKAGSGTYVAEPKILRNLQHYIPFKQTVSEAGHVFTTRVLAAYIMESNKQIAENLQLRLGHKVYALTRLREIDGEPFMIDTSYLDIKRFPGLDAHDFARQSLYYVLSGEYKTPIAKGSEHISMTYATQDEAKYLEIKTESALFFVTGIAADAHGKPTEYAKVVIHPDKVRFISELKLEEGGQIG